MGTCPFINRLFCWKFVFLFMLHTFYHESPSLHYQLIANSYMLVRDVNGYMPVHRSWFHKWEHACWWMGWYPMAKDENYFIELKWVYQCVNRCKLLQVYSCWQMGIYPVTNGGMSIYKWWDSLNIAMSFDKRQRATAGAMVLSLVWCSLCGLWRHGRDADKSNKQNWWWVQVLQWERLQQCVCMDTSGERSDNIFCRKK